MPDEQTNDTQDDGTKTPVFEPITSQEQLNALLGDRLARERAKFAGFDDLKAKAAQFDELENKNKTALDKATETASKAEQRAQAAETRLNQMLIRQAVLSAAVNANALDADAVVALISDQVTLDEQGQPVGAKQAVAALTRTKPHLFRASAGARDAGASRAPAGDGQSMDDWIRGK